MSAASIVGILVFVCGVPAVTAILLFSPKWRGLCITLMVFSTCHIKKPFYQEVFYIFYRGVDRGYGVTIPDLFFFGFALHLLIKRPYQLRWLHPALILWLMVIFISILSLINAGVVSYGLFTIHKFIRVSVLLWVMMNIIRDKRDIQAVLNGLIAALLFQGVTTLWSKYVSKTVVNRVSGSFNHPNAFAMYMDLILPVIWAAFMERILSPRAARWVLPALGMAFMCVIFTKSRAAIVLMPATLFATTCLSFIMKPSSRKMTVAIVAMLAGVIVMSAALPTIIRRFEKAPKESAETRDYFNVAAKAMAKDRFFGCGINQYAWTLKNTDYYWYMYPEALDLADPEAFRESDHGASRLGTAHNIYYLFIGETGYLGVTFYILVLFVIYMQILWTLLRAKDPQTRAVMCGLTCSFALVYLHGTLEWVWRQTQTMYLYFILAGFMIAMAQRSKRIRTQLQQSPIQK